MSMVHQSPRLPVRPNVICIILANLNPPTVLRNKFAHALTLFFLCTYVEQWPTFFSDMFTLIRPEGSDTSALQLNRHISLLFSASTRTEKAHRDFRQQTCSLVSDFGIHDCCRDRADLLLMHRTASESTRPKIMRCSALVDTDC